MPQLRDAQTSVLLAESPDPRDLAVIAESIGFDRVIFDDVGLAFDPEAAVKAAHDRANELTGLAGAEEIGRMEALAGPVSDLVAECLDVTGVDFDPVDVPEVLAGG